MSFAGLVHRALLALSAAVCLVKIGLVELVLWISQDLAAIFLDFFEEDFLRGFDIRILRVSISLGIHTQFPLWLRSSVVRACDEDSKDPGFDSRRGCAVFFSTKKTQRNLIRLSALLSLSELKEKLV